MEEEGGEKFGGKKKGRNGRSNNTVHKDSAERLVPTTTILHGVVISFSFSSRDRDEESVVENR